MTAVSESVQTKPEPLFPGPPTRQYVVPQSSKEPTVKPHCGIYDSVNLSAEWFSVTLIDPIIDYGENFHQKPLNPGWSVTMYLFVRWFRGESKNNPLGSIVTTSILKDSYPSPHVPCIMCETWEWKVWNKKIQMVNFQNGDDGKRDFKGVLCLTALHLCAMSPRIFLSSSSCGLTPDANSHLNLETIHNNNSKNRTKKTGKKQKKSNMAVTALHDQKSSIFGAPRTDLEQMKRFWRRSGRLH